MSSSSPHSATGSSPISTRPARKGTPGALWPRSWPTSSRCRQPRTPKSGLHLSRPPVSICNSLRGSRGASADKARRVSADRYSVTTLRRSRRIVAGRGTAVLLVITLLGLTALGVYSSSRFGPTMTAQIAVSFAVPALVMFFFWRAARARLFAREDEIQLELGLERVTNRATGQFLAGVSHELVPHVERCFVKAEALVVAVEYQDLGADIKIAVPEIVIETDPSIFREILHLLVGNA